MPRQNDFAAGRYLGLAPFLRRSIAGTDLQAYGLELLEQAKSAPHDANHLMNLAIATQCLGQREAGLALQRQALALQQTYYLPSLVGPGRIRILVLMAEGDLSANTPLDCLLESSDLDLVIHYVDSSAIEASLIQRPAHLQFPDHDVLMVGIGVSSETVPLLQQLARALTHWPKPVINSPTQILCTDRAAASALLCDVPGLRMPPTLRLPRLSLQEVANGHQSLMNVVSAFDFPVIVRPIDSQAGINLERVDNSSALASYLQRVDDAEFFIAPFIDYRGADGYFRKIRVVLVNGKPLVCHMAVSSDWMVHYINAGMYEHAWKRAEESAFMEAFDAFAKRHATALQAIYERTGLDYVCIDCAELPDGQLLIFEVDHSMVIHAMDLESQFPFKQIHMKKVQHALRKYLLRITAREAEQRA
jgi:glutathione synthase/RimK-type ligase-like ATP-grasp enzyme